jgi:hypothetical protein
LSVEKKKRFFVGFKGKVIESKEKSHQGPMISSSSPSLSAITKGKRKSSFPRGFGSENEMGIRVFCG